MQALFLEKPFLSLLLLLSTFLVFLLLSFNLFSQKSLLLLLVLDWIQLLLGAHSFGCVMGGENNLQGQVPDTSAYSLG